MRDPASPRAIRRRVGEHVVALACVSTLEPLCHPLIERAAESLHRWPFAAYVGFAVAVYLAGLFSARLVFRAMSGRRVRPPQRRAAIKDEVPAPLSPCLPPLAAQPDDAMIAIVVVAPASNIAETATAVAALVHAATGMASPS